MKKLKREELKAKTLQQEGKTAAEIEFIEQEEAKQAEVLALANKIHSEIFPEEYDYIYDSIADVSDRKRGINPMNKEYIEKVNAKRITAGVTSLAANGMSQSKDSWEIAYREALSRISENLSLSQTNATDSE